MGNKPIIFFDIDGTLLNDNHKMLFSTKLALHKLMEKNIPFAIVSSRSPSGIYPILKENDFNCNIIAYGGALMLDDKRNILISKGFSKNVAKDIINFINVHMLNCSINVYFNDTWLVPKYDKRTKAEEEIVHTKAIVKEEKLFDDINFVNKMLLICNKKEETDRIENMIKNRYPSLSVVKSSALQIEVMGQDINKGKAIVYLCNKLDEDINNSIAFGDNFNDEEMLKSSSIACVMGNAPEALKKRILDADVKAPLDEEKNNLRKHTTHITDSNNDDGIYNALKKLNIID